MKTSSFALATLLLLILVLSCTAVKAQTSVEGSVSVLAQGAKISIAR